MTWSGAWVRQAAGGFSGKGESRGRVFRQRAGGRGGRSCRVAALAAVPSLVASGLVPARASISGSVLILSTSVNGGTSSTEYQQATGLGLTATAATPSTWDAMTQAQFASYNAVIIGDPSGASCSTTVPSDALSTAGTWWPCWGPRRR